MMLKFSFFPFLFLSLLASVRTLNAQCSLTAVPKPISCSGANDGSITLTMSSGNGPYNYVWQHNGVPQVPLFSANNPFLFNNLSAGTYVFTVTDNLGCPAFANALVTQPSVLTLSATATNAACAGSSSGIIDLSATGGTPPYAYLWNNGANTQDLIGVVAGNYAVTATDARGCTRTSSATIANNPSPQVGSSLTDATNCAGDNGSILLSPVPANTQLTYAWKGPNGFTATNSAIVGLKAGNYEVTVTSQTSGCTALFSYTLQSPGSIELSLSTTETVCGAASGAIDLTVTGNGQPFTYDWSDGNNNEDRSGISVGAYTVTVTNLSGCTATISTTLGMKLSASTIPANCNLGSGGRIDLTVNNGSGGYTYAWSDGSATEDLAGAPADIYTVTVTEMGGCTATLSATVTLTTPLEISAFASNLVCPGAASGKIKLDITSGQAPPYRFDWSNGTAVGSGSNIPGEPFVLSGLSNGDYTITLTNAAGCAATASATLLTIPSMNLTTTVTHLSCFDSNDGGIDLTVAGGTAPYSIAWSNGSTTEDMDHLTPGIYTTTVTDANGCSATTSATVGAPTRLVVTAATSPETCFAGNNGAIDLSVSGGTPGLGIPPDPPVYFYNWSNSEIIQDLTGQMPGTYDVTVTDLNGCSATLSTTINSAQKQLLAISSVLPTTSCSASDGSVALVAPAGSQPPYNLSWSGGPASGGGPGLTISGLLPGIYTITLTDGQGCTSTALAVQSSPLLATATATPTSTCTAQDGQIQVSVGGQGSANLSYTWRRGAQTGNATTTNTNFSINNLFSGNYTVEIRDDAGCFATVETTVPQSANNLIALATSSPTTCGLENGLVVASSSGGMPVYAFEWSTGHKEPTVNNLPAGTYTVTVTEAGGCSATTSVTVAPSSSNITLAVTPITANCDGFNGGLFVSAAGAVAPINYTWSALSGGSSGSGTASSQPFTIPNLMPGAYTIALADALGCSASATVGIATAGPSFNATATATSPSTCTVADGSIQVNITGGTPPFAYNWNNNGQTGSGSASNTFDIIGLKPGWHNINITDALGCTDFVGVEVKTPADFGFNAIGIAPAGCAQSNGSIWVQTTGGASDYVYQWSNGSQQGQGGNISTAAFSIPNLLAGEYYLTIKSGQCSATEFSVIVPQPVMVMATFEVTNASACSGNNGAIDLSVSGGAPPYLYDWIHLSGANNPQDVNNLQPGTYTVIITESTGCSSSASVPVSGSTALKLFTISTPASTCATADGSIALTVTGGTPPFTYDWSHLPGANDPKDPTGLLPGPYVVTVTDAQNCTAIYTSVVSSVLMQAFATATNSSCNGQPTGAITVDFTSGVSAIPPYSYNWTKSGGGSGSGSNIATEPFQITGLLNGSYSITVTNGQGCTRGLNVSIVQGNNINISTNVTPSACNGGASGAISTTVSGGAAPYTYNWAGPANFTSNQANITNLVSGVYRLTVTDNLGCSRTNNQIFVSQPTAILYQVTSKPLTCVGGNDGTIAITVTGGTPPYIVQWTGPNGYFSTGFSIGNLPGGVFIPTITDSNGCTQIGLPVIVQSPATSVPLIAPILSYVNCNQVIVNATINASNQNYTYLWNTGDTNPILTVTTVPGVFTVTVTNVTCGTTAEKSIEVKPCGLIAGSVLSDTNKNCTDDNDPGLGSWIVKAEGLQTFFGTSLPDGRYTIPVEPGHLYTVSAVAPNTSWAPCLPFNTALVAQPFDSVPGGDFLFKKKNECPILTVDVASGNLRRCFANNWYSIKYCNEGTSEAENAYIIVTLDAFLTPVSASKPYTDLGNNQIRFDIGNVAVGKCGSINLYVKLDCNAVLGATHCTEAHIYPDTLCEPSSLQWSGASLRVSSECRPDSVRFVLKNVGIADMTQALEYIVIEDVVMMMKAKVQLPQGDSMVVKVPARGTTWRMEVEQEPFHPGLSRPAKVVEGCGATTLFSTGFVNVFPLNDADKFIDIDCRVNTNSYDPNDKQAVPTGYGAAHYIEPRTPLEYLIRFQNTGADTAFTVVIRDTLSAWLDPATVRPGASSHPYTWDLSGTGNLTFTFADILLPDSTTNIDASHGFVKYTISPKDSVPLESVVRNRAAIYFDFNAPIMTNETQHTLGKNFIVTSAWQPARAQYEVRVSPNPMGDEARLEVLGLPGHMGEFRLQVFDLQGKSVQDLRATTPVFVLRKDHLPSGMYFFRVLAEGKLVGSGKIVAE